MQSIFTKIINKEIPAYIVDETDQFIAILAKEQVQDGHTLVIPKMDIDNYLDMENAQYLALQEYTFKIAKLLKKAYPNKTRIVQNIVGFEVPHVHIHLIPANSIEEALHTSNRVLEAQVMQSILENINKFQIEE
jgi:histidine triad (HIT) family protein